MTKVRMGMVGGGEGAFIGAVHRMAAALDGEIELVCGAFSSDPARARRSGENLFLDSGRVYADYRQMVADEAALPVGERMDFVAIVTPNHLHYPVTAAALEAGFHVLCDKPATVSLDEALKLRELITRSGLIYGLAYTYNGYPMVKEARARVAAGELGRIRKILVEYPQGWLSLPEERTGNKQAEWRSDPARSGLSGCIGDIGVHAANLAEYISGLRITELCADLAVTVEGRRLDDDGSILLRFEDGARGVLTASQVCAGEENALRIRVYGERGGLEWSQQEPNTLVAKWLDSPAQMLRAAAGYLSQEAQKHCRTPGGHPEGYLEAFANLYRDFADCVRRAGRGEQAGQSWDQVPGIDEGVRGMAFIETAVSSSNSEQKWLALPSP